VRNLPWILAWTASLAGAWFLGRETAPAPEPAPESLERADTTSGGPGEPGARLQGSGGTGRPTDTSPRGGGDGVTLAPNRAPGDALKTLVVPAQPTGTPLSLDGAHTPEEILARLMAYASAQLAGGRSAQMELYKTLDRLVRDKTLERVFDDRTDGPRAVYPLVRFLVERDAQVVDMFENVLKTAVDEPSFFEGTDDDTLEVVTEGLGPILPGMVSEERMERLRGHVKAVLAQPDDRQPKALRGNRGELQGLLEQWVPALPSAEAVLRLRSGQVTGREAVALLRRVSPEDRTSLDLDKILAPMLDEGDLGGLTPAVFHGLDGRTLSGLDTRLIDTASRTGRLNDWQFRQWLSLTGRMGWEGARPFLEQALRQGGAPADAAALTLLSLQPRPAADVVEPLLRSYTINPKIVQSVRASYGIK
jgi:hypothetical protein